MEVTPKHTQAVSGWAAMEPSGKVVPFAFKRRENGVDDVTIKVHYCGMCHTDLHFINNDWGITMYPLVPGHEITGVVTRVGANVSGFRPGDRVGVGCIAASCLDCDHCRRSEENYCDKVALTYNGIFWDQLFRAALWLNGVGVRRTHRRKRLCTAGLDDGCECEQSSYQGVWRQCVWVGVHGGAGRWCRCNWSHRPRHSVECSKACENLQSLVTRGAPQDSNTQELLKRRAMASCPRAPTPSFRSMTATARCVASKPPIVFSSLIQKQRGQA